LCCAHPVAAYAFTKSILLLLLLLSMHQALAAAREEFER
jgi:hypothetical protein